MKHTIRSRIINEYGLPVVKIEQLNGEFGSGILDVNGREIFEGDKVRYADRDCFVEYKDGCLSVDEVPLKNFNDGALEIVDD